MSLTKEWFDGRDEFIKKNEALGNYALTQAIEILGVESGYLFEMGILTHREWSSVTMNLTQPTLLGLLFFVEDYQQIFITPERLEQLKQALDNWDRFTLDYALNQSDLVGTISVRNQENIEFRVDTSQFQHKLKFRITLNSIETNALHRSLRPDHVLKLWHDFDQCINVIENNVKSLTGIEIVEDINAIDSLCAE